MERQTRQLLRILADDLTDELIGVLAAGEVLEVELQRHLPGSRQTIARRLQELESWGIAISEERVTPGRGRPTRAWRLVSPAIARFLTVADELLLELLDDRAERHREAIHPPRKPGVVRQLRG